MRASVSLTLNSFRSLLNVGWTNLLAVGRGIKGSIPLFWGLKSSDRSTGVECIGNQEILGIHLYSRLTWNFY